MRSACHSSSDDSGAQVVLGTKCNAAGDNREGAEWLSKAAAGFHQAQYNLAYILQSGLGGPARRNEALAQYRAAVAQGNAIATVNLATPQAR